MGVKYDWLKERKRGWVHKAIEAGWVGWIGVGGGGGTCETLHCCPSDKEKTSRDDLVFLNTFVRVVFRACLFYGQIASVIVFSVVL